jgi:hypothetical protein
MRKRTTYLGWIATLGLSAVAAPSAHAAYVVTFDEVGSAVVERGYGALDLTDLRPAGDAPISSTPHVAPFVAIYASGARGALEEEFVGGGGPGFSDITGPSNWGPGTPTRASLSRGDGLTFEGAAMSIFVPEGYASGTFLQETSTYFDASFASLGLTPGTYVYSWGSGVHADTFAVEVGSSGPISITGSAPEPSTWAMMLIGFAGLSYAAVRRKGARRLVPA